MRRNSRWPETLYLCPWRRGLEGEAIGSGLQNPPPGPGSVGGASSHKAKGHQFDSRQGIHLGCRFGPWLGCIREATNQRFSPSLTPSVPLSLKINQIFKKKKEKEKEKKPISRSSYRFTGSQWVRHRVHSRLWVILPQGTI